MLELVQLTDFHREWVQARTMHPWVEDSCGIVALRESRPVGAVVFDQFTDVSAFIHACFDTPMVLRSDLIRRASSIAYDALGLNTLYAGIAKSNVPAVKLAMHIGFIPLGELPGAFGGGIPRLMLHMPREACVWLSEEAA